MTDRTPHGELHPRLVLGGEPQVELSLPALLAAPLTDALNALERAYLVNVLRRANGNVAEAARMAGRCRQAFYDLLARHQLEPRKFREAA